MNSSSNIIVECTICKTHVYRPTDKLKLVTVGYGKDQKDILLCQRHYNKIKGKDHDNN